MNRNIKTLALTIILLLCVVVNVQSAPPQTVDFFAGKSVKIMAHEATGDYIVGGYIAPFKAKYLKLGLSGMEDVSYASVLLEYENKYMFAGVGSGVLIGNHESLDGMHQFTLTAGIRFTKLIGIRWIHYSNGADIFQNDNHEARNENSGIDFLALNFKF